MDPGAAGQVKRKASGAEPGETLSSWAVAGETQPFRQIGVHGGLSDAELRVPLAILAS